jgi:hypothetical protein
MQRGVTAKALGAAMAALMAAASAQAAAPLAKRSPKPPAAKPSPKTSAPAAALAPAAAAPAVITLTCQVSGKENLITHMTDGSMRDGARYVDVVERYQIDLQARTVTRTSRNGTRETDEGAKPINDGAAFYTDIRSLSPTLVVYCPDEKSGCKTASAQSGSSIAEAQQHPVVLDLSAGTIAYTWEMYIHLVNGNPVANFNNTYTGKCTRG